MSKVTCPECGAPIACPACGEVELVVASPSPEPRRRWVRAVLLVLAAAFALALLAVGGAAWALWRLLKI